jgi:hypothetical protein
MSEFNYKDYLKNNPLLKNEKESLKEEVKKSSSKITISELKKKIKEKILKESDAVSWKYNNNPTKGGTLDLDPKKVGKSTVQEDEEVEDTENVDVKDTENVDVDTETDIDVTDDESVAVDDESSEAETNIDVKMPGEVNKNVELIQGLLTKAQQTAEKLGDAKLLDQIGNTITYFTRAHVVKSNVEESLEEAVVDFELPAPIATKANQMVKDVGDMARIILALIDQISAKEQVNFDKNAFFKIAIQKLTDLEQKDQTKSGEEEEVETKETETEETETVTSSATEKV